MLVLLSLTRMEEGKRWEIGAEEQRLAKGDGCGWRNKEKRMWLRWEWEKEDEKLAGWFWLMIGFATTFHGLS
jgi:hypothetical protein